MFRHSCGLWIVIETYLEKNTINQINLKHLKFPLSYLNLSNADYWNVNTVKFNIQTLDHIFEEYYINLIQQCGCCICLSSLDNMSLKLMQLVDILFYKSYSCMVSIKHLASLVKRSYLRVIDDISNIFRHILLESAFFINSSNPLLS